MNSILTGIRSNKNKAFALLGNIEDYLFLCRKD